MQKLKQFIYFGKIDTKSKYIRRNTTTSLNLFFTLGDYELVLDTGRNMSKRASDSREIKMLHQCWLKSLHSLVMQGLAHPTTCSVNVEIVRGPKQLLWLN